jgi:serine/threonine-protein kinase HipA
MTEVQVHVRIAGEDVLAGSLFSHRRRGTESATFSYASGYLANSRAYALDPGLPLRAGPVQTRVGSPLFGAFTDCAPDRWGRTLVNRQEVALARNEGRSARSLGAVDYLLGVRDDLRQGALRFRSPEGPLLAVEDSGVPALAELPELLDLARRAENDAVDLPDLRRLVRAGSSLGGARPKAHVRMDDGRLAIAKFPSAAHDTWNVMAWEKVTLDLAAAAGIDVPASRLLRIGGRGVLVVDRFDRTASGERVGYVSAMTMLEASDGDQRSYLEIAEVIEQVSAQATRELHELWRRIVFSVLVSNTDDHLRNHGFLHADGDVWRLAPAFDLNPNPAPGRKYLSTAIDASDDEASVSAALSVAELFRLGEVEARDIVGEIGNVVARWREVAARHGLTPGDISAMQLAFDGPSQTSGT